MAKTNRESPIGIFDSGIGGLTVARQIHRLLPHEDLVYLGDTARVPYGTKSPASVIRFASEDTQFLLQQNVKAVVVACNTVSAWALPTLERQFAVPIIGVILPGVKAALKASKTKRIGVIGTNTTIRSQAYSQGILARCDTAKVFTHACPLLVPLVEEGWTDHRVTHQILREYLGPLKRSRIDTLVLGCTHYPLLKNAITEVTQGKIRLIDSAQACASFVKERLAVTNLLCEGRERKGVIHPYVTDEVERFTESAKRFLGFKTEMPCKVELEPVKQKE